MTLNYKLAALVLCLGTPSAQYKLDIAAFDSYLQPYVVSKNFAGHVLIEKKGKVIFQRAYGFADREKKIRNAGTTRFHVASISMQFTAAAILRLIDQGSIRLSTHVNEIVPGIAGGDKITIRDLLLQRSGLADINDLPNYDDILKKHQTPTSLVEAIKNRALLFEPGSQFLHEEHSAYNLLALVVEKQADLPFAAAMKKLVFQPACLARSLIDDDSMPVTADVAKGYQPDRVSGLQPAKPLHWSGKTGNASLVTTTSDQARWVSTLFGDHFLKEASRQAILDTSKRVGYGWFRGVNKRYRQTAYYMNGRAPGFASFLLYLPDEKMTVVVFSNIYSSATTTIGYDLAAISLGLPYEPFRPSRAPLTVEQIKTSTGRFHFGGDFYQANAEVSLIANGSELVLRWPSGDVSPLIPVGPDRFVDRAYWQELKIERDSGGSPKTLIYDRFQGTVVEGK